MILLALDPGNQHTGVVRYCDVRRQIITAIAALENERVYHEYNHADAVLCENIVTQGGRVGAETFDTVRWIGKFQREAERRLIPFELYRRATVTNHLYQFCPRPMPSTPDARIKSALRARFTKQELSVVTGHAWSALAIAVTHADRIAQKVVRA